MKCILDFSNLFISFPDLTVTFCNCIGFLYTDALVCVKEIWHLLKQYVCEIMGLMCKPGFLPSPY